MTLFNITFDDNWLFTAGLDGAIVIYQLQDESLRVKLDKDGMGPMFADEFLIPRDKYKKKIVKIERLRMDVFYNNHIDQRINHETRNETPFVD